VSFLGFRKKIISVERERKMERKFYFDELTKQREESISMRFFSSANKIIERVLFVFQFFKLFQEKKRTTNVEVI